MNPYLMGIFVVVPSPNAQRIQQAHKAIDTFLSAAMKYDQAVRKTFDGCDAGLPTGQVFSTCTPYFLNAKGLEYAQADPMIFLESVARTCLSVSSLAVDDVLTGVCWKQEGSPETQALAGCGGRQFRAEAKAHPGPILGTYSAMLQAELIGLVRAVPLRVMGMHFPHARQEILEQAISESALQTPRTSRL